MAKKRAEARKLDTAPRPGAVRQWWIDIRKRIVSALVLATGGVLLLNYNDALNSIVKPAFTSMWAWTEDHLHPMESDTLIGVELRFFIPPNVDKQRSFEAVSATFPAKRCKRSGGASITRSFDGGSRDSYTHAIVSISCRASGRTLVKLTPQSGAPVTVYDGVFTDGEQVPFAGIPGSYYAGLLTMHVLNDKMLTGPRRPVNKCQTTNTCNKDLPSEQ